MAHVHVERQARAHDHEQDGWDYVEEAHDDPHGCEEGTGGREEREGGGRNSVFVTLRGHMYLLALSFEIVREKPRGHRFMFI